MVFIQNTYFDGVYDDIVTPPTDTATGTLSTDSMITTPTYSIPGSTLISTPVITTSAVSPPTLVPVSQSVAENDADYLAALAGTARDVTETIISTIMTGVHLIRDLIVLQITALRGYFDQIWVRETHTETLCVGTTGNETCITKEQLDALLLIATTASGTVATPTTSTTHTTVVPAPTPTTSESTITPAIETTSTDAVLVGSSTLGILDPEPTTSEIVPVVTPTSDATTTEIVITTPSPSAEIIPVIKEETLAPVVEVIPTIEEIPTVTEAPVVTAP